MKNLVFFALISLTSFVVRDVTAMPAYYSVDDILDWPCHVHDVTNDRPINLTHIVYEGMPCTTCGQKWIELGTADDIVLNVSYCYEAQDVQCYEGIVRLPPPPTYLTLFSLTLWLAGSQ